MSTKKQKLQELDQCFQENLQDYEEMSKYYFQEEKKTKIQNETMEEKEN